jgi:hypothetical protein
MSTIHEADALRSESPPIRLAIFSAAPPTFHMPFRVTRGSIVRRGLCRQRSFLRPSFECRFAGLAHGTGRARHVGIPLFTRQQRHSRSF